MTLTDRYLNAVAAQLPQSLRADVAAELRDDLASRMEAREAELGRPLTEDEEEAVLRRMGHPLVVAGRYRPGPQHLVGPDLYPWWLFAVKAGLLAVVVLVVLGFVLSVLTGRTEPGQAVGQAFHTLFLNGMVVMGLVTTAGFILERHSPRPGFMTDWRVRDLGLFEAAAGVEQTLRDGTAPAPGPRLARVNTAGRALASAAATAVALLWWTDLMRVGGLSVAGLAALGDVFLSGAPLGDTLPLIQAPVAIYLLARLAFDLARATAPGAVRAVAAGDLALAGARVAGFAWLWLASPLGQALGIGSPQALWDTVAAVRQGGWSMDITVVAMVIFGLVEAVWWALVSLARLATGRPYRR